MQPYIPRDIWQRWDAALTTQESPPLLAVPAALPAPDAIPPRRWLYGTHLVRGYVTVLVAPGGVGKSALALGQCVALATGRPLLGDPVHAATACWMLNLEDPLDELHRRLAGLSIRHAIEPAALAGRLFLHSGRARRVCMARMHPDGTSIVFPDRDAIIEQAARHGIGCIMVDPLVKSHALSENSNTDMDAAATAWAEVADATGAAVQLVHHVRKGTAGTAPDVDSARGGKALTDAARVALLLTAMTNEEAQALDVPGGERWRHVRLDSVKANMAPPAVRAQWFHLDTVQLGNATAEYPHGDSVAAIVPWRPRGAWQRLTPEQCNQVLDAIAQGPEPGLLYAPHRRGHGAARWCGHVITDRTQLNEPQAAEVIAAWLKSGLLVEQGYRDVAQRKQRTGVAVIDAKRPTQSGPTPSQTDGDDA